MKRKDKDSDIIIDELGVSRRDFLTLGAKTAGLISLSSLGTLWTRQAMASGAQTINLVSWGGAYEFSQKMAYEQPFTKATGITFQNIEKAASGPALITAQEQTGNVSWDIVDFLQAPAARLYSQGLLHEIDYDKDLPPAPDGTPATEDFVKGSLGGDGKKGAFVPEIAYDTLLSYNKTAFKDKAPQTIKDVFDVDNFPGTRALQKIPAGNLEWALYADGVPRDKIYEVLATPAGVDRAFKKLDTIKKDCIWWTEGAQPPQMLASGQAAIASAYNGRIFNAIAANQQPLDFIWDGALYEWDGWVIPAGLPKDRLELAMKFLAFSTSTKSLAEQAKYIAYAPARKSSIPLITTYYKDPKLEMTPFMPTTPGHLAVAIPKSASFWSNYGPQLKQRFSAWLSA